MVTTAVAAETRVSVVTKAPVTCDVEPTIFTASLTVTVPLVLPPIALRADALIVLVV